MKTTVKRAFLDIHEEEKWLNEQGESGLMLVGYRNGEYEFEDVSPARFLYKVDVPGYSGDKKRDYSASWNMPGYPSLRNTPAGSICARTRQTARWNSTPGRTTSPSRSASGTRTSSSPACPRSSWGLSGSSSW